MNNEKLLLLVRSEIRNNVIAFRNYNDDKGWVEIGHKKISNAKDEYDAGYCDICSAKILTGNHDRGIYALFSFPRKKRAVMPDDFKFSFWKTHGFNAHCGAK